ESYFGNYNTESNILLQLLKTDIKQRLENIPELPEEIINKRNSLWSTILNTGTENSNSYYSDILSENCVASIGPLLETNWDQGYPYNIFLPDDPVMYFVSSLAVAMAQIVNYHATINNTFFDDNDDYHVNITGCDFWIDDDYLEYDFPSFPELNLYLDTLTMNYENQQILTNNNIAALCFGCAIAVKQGNTDEWSLDKVYPGYVRFGFDQAQLIPGYHPQLLNYIIQNITDSLPVHIAFQTTDGGHSIVVDGYDGVEYFHLNWGFSGAGNGWYALPNDIPGFTSFDGIITDIKSTITEVGDNTKTPSDSDLIICPNPFKTQTEIRFEVEEKTNHQVIIYSSNGTFVKTLFDEIKSVGSYSLTWDGKSDSGKKLSPGIYLCKLQTTKTIEIKKIIIY
ncbi:MAG: C10 family peptidase, partial [Bacteroidales bacterium]|nr:C10 family peptidase [Bacteroidales bacterium]